MKISFLGAVRTVTGSQHLLAVNGYKILLDCGMYQGNQPKEDKVEGAFDFDPAEINAVLLSHAHIDHSGNLPTLVKNGYEGPIYTTHATMHLADVMMRDSAHIQEADAEYLNRKRNGNGKQVVKPLYTVEDAKRAALQLQKMEYQAPFEPAPGILARFVEAGHILGSAAIVLDVEQDGVTHRVWYSGDIGRMNLPILRDPVLPENVDTLIMESTYGDRLHPEPEQAERELLEALKQTFERGGKVIIPSFAVGRTQELVYVIRKLTEQGELPVVPVYVDSPLAVEASDIFRKHWQFFDEEASEEAEPGQWGAALEFPGLTYIRTVEESRALNEQRQPMVIISASGMANNGRILHHLANTIGDSRNTILIVSFQGKNTLGRQLAEGAEKVEIFGEVYNRKAEVMQVGGFSAHAGQDLLVEYGSQARGKQVFLVHGEEPAAEALRAKLHEAGVERVSIPFQRQVVEI